MSGRGPGLLTPSPPQWMRGRWEWQLQRLNNCRKHVVHRLAVLLRPVVSLGGAGAAGSAGRPRRATGRRLAGEAAARDAALAARPAGWPWLWPEPP